MNEKVDKNCTHLAGEYFVAAELYRRGYSVGITLGNAKAIDLFAEKDGRPVNIQVKAIRNRKSVGWPLTSEKIKDKIIYIFVCLNDPDSGLHPEYFICTADEARGKVKEYLTRGMVSYSSMKEYRDIWSKIDEALGAPGA